jgi:hypothetical protein
MATYCGECLYERVEVVQLVEGVCPKCGADYAPTADVFSIPMKVARPKNKGGK